jgi:hypothetical protein
VQSSPGSCISIHYALSRYFMAFLMRNDYGNWQY